MDNGCECSGYTCRWGSKLSAVARIFRTACQHLQPHLNEGLHHVD